MRGAMSISETPPPTSLLVLPDDALIKILSLLDSPAPLFSFFLSPTHTNNPSSFAGRLANTCTRLSALHRSRVVRCVDLTHAPSALTAPEALAAHPRADALVLSLARTQPWNAEFVAPDDGRDEYSWAAFGDGNVEALARVRGLCLMWAPSEDFSDRLVAAMPGLRELVFDKWFLPETAWTPERTWMPDDPGMKALFAQLPLGLRRVRVDWRAEDAAVQDVLWLRLTKIKELEELDLGVYSLTAGSRRAVGRCRRLKKLEVDCRAWDEWGMKINVFVSGVPKAVWKLKVGNASKGIVFVARDEGGPRFHVRPQMFGQGAAATEEAA